MYRKTIEHLMSFIIRLRIVQGDEKFIEERPAGHLKN